jgi:hypothetical protein
MRGLIRGLVSDLVPGGVISLQYADDTILFVDKEISYAENLKCILTSFYLMYWCQLIWRIRGRLIAMLIFFVVLYGLSQSSI